MRPPAPAARDTPTSRTGTPPAAGALPGEARPERSPTRGKAAPPFGAPDAQPGALPDAQPGTGPDAGADAKPSAPPPAPRKEAVRWAGASPPQRLPPVGVLPMDIPPASARPQGPHPAGFRPAKRFRRKRRPRPEPRARQTGKPRLPHPGSRRPRACPFPPSAAVPAPVPDWAYPPERLPRRVWARLRKEPRQDFRDGWRKRRARPGPTRRGTPRRTRCGTPPQASGRPHPCAPAWPLSAGIPASP